MGMETWAKAEQTESRESAKNLMFLEEHGRGRKVGSGKGHMTFPFN